MSVWTAESQLCANAWSERGATDSYVMCVFQREETWRSNGVCEHVSRVFT